MLTDTSLAQLHDRIDRHAGSSKTRDIFRSVARRMNRDLDEIDIRNPKTILMYRSRLRQGTRGIFDTIWRLLQETEAGGDLPALGRVPLVTYPHPMFADLMHLGSILGNSRLSELTWVSARYQWGWDEKVSSTALRAFEWFAGVGAAPDKETPLVVKDEARNAMRPWMVEAIINSSVAINGSKRALKEAARVRLLEKAISMAHIMQLRSDDLRNLCRLVMLLDDTRTKALEDVLARSDASELAEWVLSQPPMVGDQPMPW